MINLKSIAGKIVDNIHGPGIKSYSQEGEDLILRRYFDGKKNGFYIDIGAYHPTQISNTYYFYRKGWSGINIDANPDSIDIFNKRRTRDTNLLCAVGKNGEELSFYRFQNNVSAINTFEKPMADQMIREGYAIKDIISVTTQGLSEILAKHVDPKQKIDFMSVDVEGHELSLLTSNNWDTFRPEVLLVEILGSDLTHSLSLAELKENPVYAYLESIGYVGFAKTYNTVFFKSNIS